MKLSSQEEYGLRCLLRLAQQPAGDSLTLLESGVAEEISAHNVAKYLRLLRQGGFVDSERGQHGGYTLAGTPESMVVGEVLAALGGRLFEPTFCDQFAGVASACQHSMVDCSLKDLWSRVQNAVDEVLSKTMVGDLLGSVEVLETATTASSERQELLQVAELTAAAVTPNHPIIPHQ